MKRFMMLTTLLLTASLLMAEEALQIPVTKVVYAGKLIRGITGEALNFEPGAAYDMTLKVYETEDASEAKGTYTATQVAIEKDGSFTATFGNAALTELCATGVVQFVGLTIGGGNELKPRRELKPVAKVTRALVADQPAGDILITTLEAEGALIANEIEVDTLEATGSVSVAGPSKVTVAATRLLDGEKITVKRGKGVKVFASDAPTCLAVPAPINRNQFLTTAPFAGLVVISSTSDDPELKIPAVTLFCREGEEIYSPSTVSAGGVSLKFLKFAK